MIGLTSGSSTLGAILTAYGSKICTINTNVDMTGVTSNPCIAYSFSTKPVTSVVSDYINWITTNMCGMYTALNAAISPISGHVDTLMTYITGSTTGSVPTSIDTSCLAGGSTTSNLKDAVVLIKNNLFCRRIFL